MSHYKKATILIISVLLIIGLASPSALPGYTVQYHAQPALLDLASVTPLADVAVIVQKLGQNHEPEQLVKVLGGNITKNLSFINAFAAEMTADAARDLSASPHVRWVSLDTPVQTSAVNGKFTTWATKAGTAAPMGFANPQNALSPIGPNQTFASGGRIKGAFTGFLPEYSPETSIFRIEIAARLYFKDKPANTEYITFTPYVAGKAQTAQKLTGTAMPNAKSNTLYYLDITATRAWKWADLLTTQILVDQAGIARTNLGYLDAVGLRITTGSGTDSTSPLVMSSTTAAAPINTSILDNTFQQAVRAVNVWNEGPGYFQGQNITVAVVDSGSFKTNAIGSRLIGEVNFNSAEHTSSDQYGHGTFVTGVIADDGMLSGGKYIGIAPKVNILGVRVSDDMGMSSESDVISALQWIYTNKGAYNIRVVNLSLNSSAEQSYHVSPLAAAAEILWFNGIVVVCSAGNNGSANLYAPANDPFVITVGATNDMGTPAIQDDVIASYSAYGVDEMNQTKPDLVAPGSNIIAYLPDHNLLAISNLHPENRVDVNYFRMSGTSMSAPIVSGAVAMLLNANPNLNPDQVKYRLMATANKAWANYDPALAGAGYLDVYAAVHSNTIQTANTGLVSSQLLWSSENDPLWGSVAWNSVAWNSVAWNSVAWNSVAWNSVAWNSDYWGQ